LLRDMPIEHIAVETDAPDFPPSFLGTMGSRERNAPEHVARIGAMLAEVRRMSVDAFAEATTGNVRRVLGR
jgi:TatD DNase family protein